VKGLLDREAAKAHLTEEAPSEAESGTAYLQRRKQVQDAEADLDDWLDETAEGLLDPLRAPARETRVLPVQGNAGREADVVFNWAFLVPSANVEAFRAEVERAEQDHEATGLTLDLTGPWPPYNFRPSLEEEREDS
jgi:Gas vesicle synthesis protein GvpL/GvpF.